jgi:hypothetical protein
MARHKDYSWNVGSRNENGTFTWGQIKVSLLMDIRDELQKLNARLGCIETLRIPRYLRRIANNTAKPRKKT